MKLVSTLKSTLASILLMGTSALFSQGVIVSDPGGPAAPDSNAILHLYSPNKGLLIPRMDSTARMSINDPAEGLAVFDTSTQTFWYSAGGTWTELMPNNLLHKAEGMSAPGKPIPLIPNQGDPPTRDTISLSQEGFISQEVQIEVCLNITHTWDSDVHITLYSPAGTAMDLTTGQGSDGDNFTQTCFTTSATTPIYMGSPPFTGYFQPVTPFNVLLGEPVSGDWILQITDSYPAADDGVLVDWSLRFMNTAGARTIRDKDLDTYISVEPDEDADEIRFVTRDSIAMRIDSLGRIGIGSAPDPTVALRVEADDALHAGVFKNLTSGASDYYGVMGLAYGSTSGTNYGIKAEAINGASNIAIQGIGIAGANNFGAKISGKVHLVDSLTIGTMYPKNRLDVAGGIALGSGYAGVYLAPPDGAIIAGSLGIGTPGTLNKLDVNGSMALGSYAGTNTAPGNGMIMPGKLGVGTSTVVNQVDVEGAIAIGNNYSGSMVAPANGAIIQGNVGIGTSSPAAKLEVTGSSNFNGLTKLSGLIGDGVRPVFANPDGELIAPGATDYSASPNAGFAGDDCNGVSDVIHVSGFPAPVPSKNICVKVNIDHNRTQEVRLYLKSPAGDVLNLFKSLVSGGADMVNTMFCDDGADLTGQLAPYTGVWQPAGDMITFCAPVPPTTSTFAGIGNGTINPNGDWTLYVLDALGGLATAGVLLDWTISFNANASIAGEDTRFPFWQDGKFSLTSSIAEGASNVELYQGVAIGSGYAGVHVAPANGLISEGQLGIGTPTPDAWLHLQGPGAGETDGLKISQGAQNSVFYHNLDGDFVLRKLSLTDQLVLSASGGVGIGTKDVINMLDVDGGVAIGSAYAGFNTAPANGAIIQGDVAIGYPLAQAALDVRNSGTGESKGIRLYNGGYWTRLYHSSGGDLIFARNNNANQLVFKLAGHIGIGSGMSIGAGYSGSTPPANGAIIEGNVGLGTTSPQNTLDVEGALAVGAGYSGTSTAPANGVIVEGSVGIGTSSPGTYKLNILHGNDGLKLQHVSGGPEFWELYHDDGGDGFLLNTSSGNVGKFNYVSGEYTYTSDRRLKEDFRDLNNVLSRIMQLKPLSYSYRRDPVHKTHIGFIAQDVENIFPQLVMPPTHPDEPYTMNYSGFGVIAIAAIQELIEENGQLTSRISEQQARLDSQARMIAEQEKRLARLETLVSNGEMTLKNGDRHSDK